jgi:putative ABC transport system permease protein
VFAEIQGPRFLASSRMQILATLRERHGGDEDVTLISQGSLLGAFTDILATLTLTLTLAVSGIAVISLLVAGILIMNVTWISVSQRTDEIGLLKAIGATAAQVRLLFLGEALLLSVLGGVLGLLLMGLLLLALHLLLPGLPFSLQPVQALHCE